MAHFTLTMLMAIAGALLATVAAAVFFLRRGAKKTAVLSAPAEPSGAALKDRLELSRQGWAARMGQVFKVGRQIDDNLYRELEETLITADIGARTSGVLLDNLRRGVARRDLKDSGVLKDQLKTELLALLQNQSALVPSLNGHPKPKVILIVGVNGVGKTTTIGKLASKFQADGKSVMLAAGDTFRAAAVEQLQIWGERSNVPVIAQKEGNDPSAVAYDAVEAACARGIDVLLIDTAGRLHTKVNLMEELKKVLRTIRKKIPEAPHEIWLVLDATTGQNALVQARTFHETLGGITGIILTKLDGTAKGGVLISLVEELKLPVRFIGVGESIADLRPFEPNAYVDALFAD